MNEAVLTEEANLARDNVTVSQAIEGIQRRAQRPPNLVRITSVEEKSNVKQGPNLVRITTQAQPNQRI